MNYSERRELDCRIHLKIFGKNYIPCTHLFCACPTVPHYCTDLNEAWKVVEVMAADDSGAGDCFVREWEDSGDLWAFTGKEVALWICQTALDCLSISITDNGKREKSTESSVERTPCPSSKMGMSERSCFPTSTKSSMIRITTDRLKKWGLHRGVEKLILRETEWQYLVYAGGSSVAKVWVHKHECEAI